MNNNIINHAIIGCGRIAQNHYNAAKANGFNISFCCDLDINKAKIFAEKNHIENYTDNFLDLLNDDIDSVSICTDHKSHIDIANSFVNKKHIIIEKPLSINVDYANKLNENNNSKVVSVIAQHRFDDVVCFVKKLIKEKAFGEITLVNANLICNRSIEYYKDSYWRGTLEKEGGSTIINQSFHIVDTLVFLFGKPNSVKSFKKNLCFKDIIETEDTCVSILDYNSFLCTLSSTNTSKDEWLTYIEIIGTNGKIKFNIDFPEEIIYIDISSNLLKKYKNELKNIEINYKNNLKSPANYYGLSHISQFKNFKDAILSGSSIKVGILEAKETLSVIDMIYKD